MKILISITILFAMMTGNAAAQVNLDSGLIAFYPFNGSADDESGNVNHGEAVGAVLTIDRFGNENAAYEFDGTSSYITIPNSETLQSPDTELSQVAWINIYSWSNVGSQFGPILMKSDSGANAFQYRLSVGQDGINTAINNWSNAVGISDTLNFNEWYMVVSTLKDDTVKTYINGIFVGEGTLTGPMSPDSRPLEIGRDVPGSIEVFHGKIDDVRIYNRALTEMEIIELYSITTDIIEIDSPKLNHYQLFQNFPNPFNPTTTIKYEIPADCHVEIVIYDITGRKIAVINSQMMNAGIHEVFWNGKSSIGENAASGLYLFKISAGEYMAKGKMVLIR